MARVAAIDTLLDTFLSDDHLIEYLSKEVKRFVKENQPQNQQSYSRIISEIIDKTFEDLELGEVVATFLEKATSKSQRTLPEFSETEPKQTLPLNRRKEKKKISPQQHLLVDEIPTVEIDFNKTQYINPQNVLINEQEDEQSPIASTEYHQKEQTSNPDVNVLEAETQHQNDLEDNNSIHFLQLESGRVDEIDIEIIPPDPTLKFKPPRHVNFVDGLVSDTFYHREKHTPDEVPDLFYTHDESIRFQFDYDREAQRADNEGISWLDWMMKRTEEERARHEEEDELLQHEYQDYWEGNEQYEEDVESQQSDEMWEF